MGSMGRSGEPGASKASDSSKLHSSPSASPERLADAFDADVVQTVDRIDGPSPGRVLRVAPSPGEQVLFCKLLRDGILKHFNPWKLRDLQCVLELRCFKGVLSDTELKHFFESSLEGECRFALGDLRGSESLRELRERVEGAHRRVIGKGLLTFRPHLTKIRSLKTKEVVLREYKMLTYVPTEVYRAAVAGAHVLREVGRLGLVAGGVAVDTTKIDKKLATRYLFLACRAGLPASAVSALIAACPPSLDVGTLLKQAASGNHLDLIDVLLEHHGARVPRHCLVGLQFTAGVRTVGYLVEHGADVHAKENAGLTILHRAARAGNLDMVRFLVNECGADVHAKGYVGTTVLHEAAGSGNLDMVRFLVDEHNADAHAEDSIGLTILHKAAGSGNLHMVRFLVDEHNADVHAKDSGGGTALHEAAYIGNLDVVRFLLDEHGVDVHAKRNSGMTVLHLAAKCGNLDLIRFLVDEHGVDVHAKNYYGLTVLSLTTDPMSRAFLRDRMN